MRLLCGIIDRSLGGARTQSEQVMAGKQPSKRHKPLQPLSQPIKPVRRSTRGQGTRQAESAPPAEDDQSDRLDALTLREREVLSLYVKHSFNAKRVAKLLDTQPQTVRNQLTSIEHKLGVHSREELVAKITSLNGAAPPATS